MTEKTKTEALDRKEAMARKLSLVRKMGNMLDKSALDPTDALEVLAILSTDQSKRVPPPAQG